MKGRDLLLAGANTNCPSVIDQSDQPTFAGLIRASSARSLSGLSGLCSSATGQWFSPGESVWRALLRIDMPYLIYAQ
jgi:hypothetical protein